MLPHAPLHNAGKVLLAGWLICTCWPCVASQAAGSQQVDPSKVDAAALEFFEKEVRPILANRCYECHSGKLKEAKGGLRVDSRAALLAGGDTGPAVVPGDLQQSLLIDAVNYGDIYQMPPKSKLPASEIERLTKWVRLGAPWPDEEVVGVVAKDQFDLEVRKQSHWCWQPVQARQPPPVRDDAWPQHDLDRFILAQLELAGLTPAPPADKRTWIRRVSFDLTGLPPLPREVAALLADESPQAFARVVDRLLESPHFGERWARHWMDLVRYAETYGHEFDYPIPHASKYRDYLIRAFNADVPYDQFVLEHIAGDLLPDPRRHPTEGFNESIIGTGFWWLGEATHAPVDVRGDEAGRVDNQLDVMGKTFLALTIGCARCHDHKFDAVSTRDYYALAGFLQSSHRRLAALDPHDGIQQVAGKLRVLAQEADQQLVAAVAAPSLSGQDFANYLLAAREVNGSPANLPRRSISAVATELGLDVARLEKWVAAVDSKAVRDVEHPLHTWAVLAAGDEPPTAAEIDGQRRQQREAAAKLVDRDERYPLLAGFDDGFGGWMPTGHAFVEPSRDGRQWDAARGRTGLAANGVAHSGMLSRRLQGVLRSPTFTLTHKHLHYRIAGENCKVMLIVDGYFMYPFNGLLFRGFAFDVNTDGQFVWHKQAEDVGRYLGHRAHIEIIDHGGGFVAVDEIRLSDEDASPTPVPATGIDLAGNAEIDSLETMAAGYGATWDQAVAAFRAGQVSAEQLSLLDWALTRGLLPGVDAVAPKLEAVRSRMQELSRELSEPQRVLAMCDGSGENERIFVRGNHRLPGDEVPRQMLEALVGRQPAITAGSGRLLLARQIVDPANPLAARVMVNRIWHHLFGRGIVASVDNFGVLGQRPTHPELLDFLAHRWTQEGWSVKQLLRALVLSSTYRMASTPNADADKIDPQNLLLHRMRIRRLQGEAIHDAILSLSGRLDRDTYGTSVPVHITPFMQGRGRPGGSGPLDGNGRRSIYTEVRRNFLPPMMLAFDTPIPFNTVGRRNTSNVPAQALILMNDPFVVEQAQRWAGQVLRDERLSVSQRVARLYESAFARPPTADELNAALAFLARQGNEYGLSAEQSEQDPKVWSDLCHVLMNVKEFVFIN